MMDAFATPLQDAAPAENRSSAWLAALPGHGIAATPGGDDPGQPVRLPGRPELPDGQPLGGVTVPRGPVKVNAGRSFTATQWAFIEDRLREAKPTPAIQ